MKAADDSWMERAACLGQAAAGVTFFSAGTEGGGSSSQMYSERRVALGYCEMCKVREECLEYALTTGQEYGIWGGLTEKARRKVRKQRRAALREAS